jgi:hypothetical protein
MRAVTLKLSERIDCRLTALARRQGTRRAQVLREALEAFIAHSPPLTVRELAGDSIIDDGPGDLSTNPGTTRLAFKMKRNRGTPLPWARWLVRACELSRGGQCLTSRKDILP